MHLALLVLRATTGILMAGHGAQKLFGWFGGYGLKGTAGWLESLGLRPGRPWAIMAGLSELGGGLLVLLGFLTPLGSLGLFSSMLMATLKVHWGKPIWVTSGGAELPVINMAVAIALMLTHPGKYSLDDRFGIRLPAWITPVGLLIATSVALFGVFGLKEQTTSEEVASEEVETLDVSKEEAGAGLQAGTEAAHPV